MGGPDAGYSGTPLAKKLGFRDGMRVALLHAPEGMDAALQPVPPQVAFFTNIRRGQEVDLIIDFVTERNTFATDFKRLAGTLPPDGAFWVAWPKRSSKVRTDMTDHVVRDIALPTGWVDVKVCAIDATWSGLKLVLRRELRPLSARRRATGTPAISGASRRSSPPDAARRRPKS